MTSLKSSSSHSSNSRSPSLNTKSTTNTFLYNSSLPALSITNKPSNGTSLYHTCRSVLEKLSLVPNIEYYIDYTTDDDTTPSNKLWTICRRRFPLAALFNASDPQEPLSVDPSCTQINECKKSIYHFIVACKNQLGIREDDLFTLSDLYKDNTNRFVKVVSAIDIILQILEE
ncbi:CDC24-domain-containing protein [Rhizopus microsporus var. microsporus]|uniref:CDC24-domain-containing protein n=1 Tax=Rhizopus microsporus var. microsporus TaxID=86635 RepID=A0A1X0QQP0_RHIZD|nr:CDC24-domain-containing protein [Rhizopus microsporus var. microsporus]